jgi:hypothetical protein
MVMVMVMLSRDEWIGCLFRNGFTITHAQESDVVQLAANELDPSLMTLRGLVKRRPVCRFGSHVLCNH